MEKALGDLLAFGVVSQIVETKDFALAGQRKLRIEGRPIDLVAKLDAGESQIAGVEAVEELRASTPSIDE